MTKRDYFLAADLFLDFLLSEVESAGAAEPASSGFLFLFDLSALSGLSAFSLLSALGLVSFSFGVSFSLGASFSFFCFCCFFVSSRGAAAPESSFFSFSFPLAPLLFSFFDCRFVSSAAAAGGDVGVSVEADVDVDVDVAVAVAVGVSSFSFFI